MGKKIKKQGLGRSLVKKQDHKFNVSSRHTTDTNPVGISVTETTDIDEFIANAEAAQRSFTAERGTAVIVGHEDDLSDLSEGEYEDEDGEDEEDLDLENFCSIPKKPQWDRTMEAAEYQQLETVAFLRWKKQLSMLQKQRPQLPPFEKNLEFWKQLWKIVEISDVVVQVVDARDPLFYNSTDLASYVKEVAEWKTSVLLLNKADFLTKEQRQMWADYFQDSDLQCLFFSATESEDSQAEGDAEHEIAKLNSSEILTPKQVLEALQTVSKASPLTVGFVGYPNVGKSSTINRFLTNKKIQVSATPGKTKHYQTHNLLKGEVVLVDGPGLVIPNLSMTKADMILHGILPIDNLTDCFPSMDKLLTQIPFAYIQKFYGIMASCVKEAKKQDRLSSSNQILSAFGLMRGLMKPGGLPDQARAARVILKDYVNGKLLYAQCPPNSTPEVYCPFEALEEVEDPDLELRESFPELTLGSGAHVRGVWGQKKAEGMTLAQLKTH